MQWDLGIQGVGVLLAMSVGFGLFAQFVIGLRRTPWVGVASAAALFVAGLLISEAWFGWATEEDLRPNIDGLSFDEVLLLAIFPGIVAVLVARFVVRKRMQRTGLN